MDIGVNGKLHNKKVPIGHNFSDWLESLYAMNLYN